MKEVAGIWLPDHEEHLVERLEKSRRIDGKGTYQHEKLTTALEWVKNWRCAVDVGAHVGLWSMHLVKRFGGVHAFEPVNEQRECFGRNVTGASVYSVALGAAAGRVSMSTKPGSSGDSGVDGYGDIEMSTLDRYELHFVDFIKLDCVGYELNVLRGAEETLKRCRPCVCVEQKPGYAQRFGLPETGAVEYLQSLGAKLRLNMSGVYVLSFD